MNKYTQNYLQMKRMKKRAFKLSIEKFFACIVMITIMVMSAEPLIK